MLFVRRKGVWVFVMKNLYDTATVVEVKERIARLQPDSERQWGKMNSAQAVAHCCASMETAVGMKFPKRVPIGRVLAPLVKSSAFKSPLRRNSPSEKSLIVTDQRELGRERERLYGLIDRFAAAGPAGCTTHPHSFFGKLTPEEWATWMYKHLDHHLGQFGV
jgi:hypothetical protein